MRNLNELNITEKGRRVTRPPPSAEDVRAFESHHGITLPEEHLALLRHANGGHPQVDSIVPVGCPDSERWAVNRFFELGTDREMETSLWKATERWKPILGSAAVPFAQDGGGNPFFLDFSTSPPSVKVCVHDEGFTKVTIAPNFTGFIDGLSIDPDMI